MFAQRLWTGFNKEKRARKIYLERNRKADDVVEQVRQVLQTADQQLILMVRS